MSDLPDYTGQPEELIKRVELEKVVRFALENDMATGHSDNMEDLLSYLSEQIREMQEKLSLKEVRL